MGQKIKPTYTWNSKELFTITQVSKMINKSSQTIALWVKWKLIPEPYRIGSNRVRCWSKDQIKTIRKFSKSIKYGDLAKLSRTQWGSKSLNMCWDRSTENKELVKIYRKKIDKQGKKLENERKLILLKMHKSNSFKLIRRRAKMLYKEINATIKE